jgi:hypothetical protein
MEVHIRGTVRNTDIHGSGTMPQVHCCTVHEVMQSWRKGKGRMTDHLPMREHVPVGHGVVGALLRLPLARLPQVLWVLSYPEVQQNIQEDLDLRIRFF